MGSQPQLPDLLQRLSNSQQHEPDPLKKVHVAWAGHDLQRDMQNEVAGLLKRNNPTKFPGAQPVSFTRDHFDELKRTDYYVCEKTDGLRYLMFLTYGDEEEEQAVYLIDRKNDYYYLTNLHFPHHENNPGFKKIHRQTILDGELVEDRLPNGTTVIKFLAFDLLVIDGKDMRERPLDKRLGYLKQFVLTPYKQWLAIPKKGTARWWDYPPAFHTEDKKVEFSYALPRMFNEIIPQVKQLHGNDGLIFTCRDTKYESGTDRHILKWKPPEENTVDFLMHIEWAHFSDDGEEDYDSLPEAFKLFIFEGKNEYSYVGLLFLTPDEWEHMKALNRPLQHSIIECFLEAPNAVNGFQNGEPKEQKRWRFHRFRDDKEEANHSTTFASVQQSIEDHVTQQDLLNHADEMRNAWKARQARSQSVRS